MKLCPKCQAKHSKSGAFCSRKCANSRGPRSEDFKSKVRLKLKITRSCIVCEGPVHNRRKTCSARCLTSYKKTTQKPPRTPGGYKPGSGRGKHGWYQGYYLDSNYELAYLIYCLDHNIPISRNTDFFLYTKKDGTQAKYYPDFRVNDRLTEIKGYYADNLDEKLNSVTEPIDVLFPKDLQHVFSYVEDKTGLKVKDLYTLYDGDPNGYRSRSSTVKES